MNILITGVAGFIGFHLAKRLLEEGFFVIGLDNLNDYYDVNLKKDRLKQIENHKNFRFYKVSLKDRNAIENIFKNEKIDKIVNLAAQAGVRYSLVNPYSYINSNIVGFLNLLEGARHNSIKHFIFASSSSVYGANTKMPFSVHDNVDHPVSLYAASKKSNELMAHSYASLYNIPCTGLRFFTVYGPWGRPDMAYFLFTKAIINNNPIKVFNDGKMQRDFTYIDDIIESVYRVIKKIPKPNSNWNGKNPDSATSYAPYKIYNIGNNKPVELIKFINILEKSIGKEAKKEFLPMQKGDVVSTFANVDDLIKDIDFNPKTKIEDGIKNFIDWYKYYYN